MSLNYQQDNYKDELISWNYELNIEDILHDMVTSMKKSDLAQNTLFHTCLSEMLSTPTSKKTPVNVLNMINDNMKASAMDGDATFDNPIKIPKNSNKKHHQLRNVNYTIHDTFSGKRIGIADKITPSHYFDPANRTNNHKIGQEITNFLIKNNLSNKPIDLTKYGFTDTTVKINVQSNKLPYIQFTITTPYEKDFITKIELNSGFTIPEDENYEYLGGNPAKSEFFKNNETNITPVLVKHGKRFILCKLLGDLMHTVFAGSGDCVFTLDTYLRDRCIKNKVDVICRTACDESMKDCIEEYKGGGIETKTKGKTVVAKTTKPAAKTTRPAAKSRALSIEKLLGIKPTKKRKPRLNIFYYYPTNFQSGAGSDKQIGGSKQYIFENESNKLNLLDHIDNYLIKLNNFGGVLTFNMYGNNVACSDNVKNYIQNLYSYLSGDCKQAIMSINTSMGTDEFNKELTKWFPQDILYSSEDMETEIRPITTQYFSPTSVKVIFPYNKNIPNEINYFTYEKISFDRFVRPELEPPTMSPYTLNDLLTYFGQTLRNIPQPDTSEQYLLGSDEIEKGLELITKIKNKHELQNDDDFVILMDHLIDSSFTTEDDLLKAYLMVICGNDEIKAYTIYTSLLPLTYFNGFNIYDYEILTKFVKKLGVNESLPGGYEAFMELIIGSEEPETVFPTMKTGMNINEMEIDKPIHQRLDKPIQQPLMIGSGKKKKYSRKKSNSKTTNNKIKIHGNRKTHKKKYTRRNKKI
jgi:hypothetical protein